ncbi:MAG: HAMP domain-containing sensor histidine kinase [Thermoplasmatota archaeon]
MILVAAAMLPTAAFVAWSAADERSALVRLGANADSANVTFVRDLAALGIISVVAFGAAWILADSLIVLPLQQIVEAARRLARGELGARTGVATQPGEVGELAASFDEMAASLEAQQEELKKVDRLKTRIINSAAHELNTPLTPMKLQLNLLKSGHHGDLGEGQKKAVGVVDRNVDRLSVLVANMLDVTRLKSGRFEVKAARQDLNALVDEAVAAFDEPAREAGVTLIALPTTPIFVYADGERVLQVLYNLLSNALKFTPRGGHIDVELAHSMGDARVTVRDDGQGIARDRIAGLFEAFAHGDANGREGAGLGLYLARGIVQQHRGEMGCESAGPGTGATFWFTLPIDRTPAQVAEVTNRI